MQEENLFAAPALLTGFTIRWSIDLTNPQEMGQFCFNLHHSQTPRAGHGSFRTPVERQDRWTVYRMIKQIGREWDSPGANVMLPRSLRNIMKEEVSEMRSMTGI